MSNQSRHDSLQRLALARTRLLRGWHDGTCPAVEAILLAHPELQSDADAVVDLVHVEAVLRQVKGEPLALTDLCGRFPHHADAIRARLALDPCPATDDPAVTVPPAAGDATAPAAGDFPRVPGYEILGELGRAAWASSTAPDRSSSVVMWR
jgi:hypothetical protein